MGRRHLLAPSERRGCVLIANLITADQARIKIGHGKSDNVYIEGRRNPIGTITSQAPASWDYEVHGSYGNRLGTAEDKGQALRMIVDAWNQRQPETAAPPGR